MGGFSSRLTFNEFGTVLPFSDIDEAEEILADFTEDLNRHGLSDISPLSNSKPDACFDFGISAGLSRGKPSVELESIMEFARYKKRNIARFRCEMKRSVNEKIQE